MFCDGSFISDSSPASYGITIANSQGHVYDGKTETFLCSHPIQAEAFGLLNAIRVASQDNIPTCISTDCRCFSLRCIRNPRHGLGCVGLPLRRWFRVEFVPRRLNRLANWEARHARVGSLPVDWILIVNIIAPLL
ncbi:unnamed protein product [Linum trigynum]|uniref:RNase H type-1 domain-containing protein n=1 Tax=Linum trigynum TaxID=586398 RepID=A0AAV2EIF6_9ROSI